MMDTTEQLTPLAIPIAATDRKQAYQFAAQQPTQERSEQVYRNTLAVLVMHHCLQLLGIDSDVEVSQSWNPLDRLLSNIADLYVPRLQGFLECRPVHQSSQKCEIPEEVWADRIGYVVIQIDAPYQKGYILGFVESVSVPELPLSYLQPFNRLIEKFLERSSQPTVQLKQWLQRMFEPDWQPSEDILNAIKGSASRFSQLQPYRTDTSLNSVQRRIEQLYRHRFSSQEQSVSIPLDSQEALIQLIQTTQNDEIRWQSAELLWELDPHHPNCPVISARDLGFYLVGYSIALMVGILPKSEDKMLVLLRVYPLGKLAHLPAKLKFTGLDDAGNPFFEVESRQQDDYIQFKFTGDVGDRFSICISLHEVNFTESFVI